MLIGLAFSLMANTLTAPIQAYVAVHPLGWSTLLDLPGHEPFWTALLFLLTVLNFVVGIQVYARTPSAAGRGWERWDFVFTVLTLSALAGLGAMVGASDWFVCGLGLLYLMQCLWAWPHRRERLVQEWLVLDAGTAALTWTFVLGFLANDLPLDLRALAPLAAIHLLRLVAEWRIVHPR